MESSRQEYWSGLPFLLQEIFPTQRLNPGLLHCRQILYRLSHQDVWGIKTPEDKWKTKMRVACFTYPLRGWQEVENTRNWPSWMCHFLQRCLVSCQHNQRVCALQWKILHYSRKISHAITNTQWHQINKMIIDVLGYQKRAILFIFLCFPNFWCHTLSHTTIILK